LRRLGSRSAMICQNCYANGARQWQNQAIGRILIGPRDSAVPGDPAPPSRSARTPSKSSARVGQHIRHGRLADAPRLGSLQYSPGAGKLLVAGQCPPCGKPRLGRREGGRNGARRDFAHSRILSQRGALWNLLQTRTGPMDDLGGEFRLRSCLPGDPKVLSFGTAVGGKSRRVRGPHTAVPSCGTSDSPAFA
jgi:hypothetical protein